MKARISLLISACFMTWACDEGGRAARPDRTIEAPAGRLASPGAASRGRAVYLEKCAVCHGDDGRGRGPRARTLASRPRDLTRSSWQRAQTPEGLFRVIRDGIPGTDMPAWKALDEEEIWDLVAYLRSLDRGGSS